MSTSFSNHVSHKVNVFLTPLRRPLPTSTKDWDFFEQKHIWTSKGNPVLQMWKVMSHELAIFATIAPRKPNSSYES